MFTTDFMIWKKYICLFLIVTEGQEVLDCSTEGGVPDPVLLLWGQQVSWRNNDQH